MVFKQARKQDGFVPNCHVQTGQLPRQGLESQIIVTGENRANVVAKFEGIDQGAPGLVVHGHLDVVPVTPEDWSVDPFAAEIKDGCIWGRGAVDMKNVDAMILATSVLENKTLISFDRRMIGIYERIK